MAVAATALAFIMLSLDRSGNADINYWWIYTGGADGARSLLEAVAGSMVSVAATAFSITIVALQLAASNFGIAIGAVWEVIEWSAGKILSTEVIGSLDDTIIDLIMDSLGAGLAALISLWALQ
ncbi:hypothetical protein NIES2100_38050 [Calothrix sp. NIES-2100]|nr:hypothetical protein NIES2100_38050 [Calothrix sp. NIES-2100]